MTNVVRLQAARPRTYTSAERLIEEVRTKIFEHGGTYKEIAASTGVSGSTISNLAQGKTRWPRPTTLFPLLNTLKLGMRLVRLENGDE